jgi:YfiR/HmsC-like
MKLRLLIIGFFFICSQPKAQSIEYSIKASLMFKFARFTNSKQDSSNGDFLIMVLGESPFKGELERLAAKVKIRNKLVRVKYTRNIKEVKFCQLLFISRSEKDHLQEILKQISSTNILTVSNSPNFGIGGVHINFFSDESNTIKYEINPLALKKSNLTMEMQLLAYAKIISNG